VGEFVKVASASEIAPGQARLVNIKGKEIALFNIEGSFFALDNACTHEEGPLAEGDIDMISPCPLSDAFVGVNDEHVLALKKQSTGPTSTVH
jgi:nitrite reductase/ring-hydroxylating ferredoxin subunit